MYCIDFSGRSEFSSTVVIITTVTKSAKEPNYVHFVQIPCAFLLHRASLWLKLLSLLVGRKRYLRRDVDCKMSVKRATLLVVFEEGPMKVTEILRVWLPQRLTTLMVAVDQDEIHRGYDLRGGF